MTPAESGHAGTGDYLTDLLSARDNIARQLADLTAQPKPSYQIDGQQVSWDEHFRTLCAELERLNYVLQTSEPFEFHSTGYTD